MIWFLAFIYFYIILAVISIVGAIPRPKNKTQFILKSIVVICAIIIFLFVTIACIAMTRHID